MRPIVHLDLYCGAGGWTTGFEEAMLELGIPFREIAANHWCRAIETMVANHPNVIAMQADIEAITPDDIEADVIDHLHASPSCTHHSRAKGGKPRSNQLRSQPNEIWKFVDNKHVRRITIENVPEFTKWGPLTTDGKPIKRMEGSCFRAWLEQFTARGYDYEWRILNCADYGDATSRKRFFLQAVKRRCGLKIRWPKPTHAEHPKRGQKRWRGVSECLDYSDTGRSIFGRDNPLAENTLRRIAAGAERYWGIELKPFIVRFNRNCDAESVDDPIPCVTTNGHYELCTPIVMDHFKGGNTQDGSKPLGSQTTHDRYSVIQPFVIDMSHPGDHDDARRVVGSHEPMKTITTRNNMAVLQPLILGQNGGATCRPDSEPCPTIATGGAIRKIEAFVIDMNRPGGADSGHIRPSKEPMRTITTYDNVQGVFPVLEDGRVIDIRIRMLKPSELSAAHSFPKGYKLSGSRADQVKQIGNSVPVQTAKALVKAMFGKAV
jgi:DNA (cytosine-5)-methyltransferase 1